MKINDNSPIFIIAELSANHNQDYGIAIKTIEAISKSGANAVKLQTYTPETITINCNNKYFQIKSGLWKGKTLYELYKEAFMPWDWQVKLKKIAEDLGLIFFSTPFDKTAVDFLETLNVPMYKIASFEITDTPLIEYIASKRKPVIISTGIAKLKDIKEAINICKDYKCDTILLKCTSIYPTPIEETNLLTIPDMKKRFKTTIGLSDHTLGCSIAIASVVLGVKVIEKHFILNKELGGLDSSFSMEPEEFKYMVKSIREVEKSLGSVSYKLSKKIKKSREHSKSLFVIKDIMENEILTEDNIKSIRPGTGMHPKYLEDILGRKVNQKIKRGEPLNKNMIL